MYLISTPHPLSMSYFLPEGGNMDRLSGKGQVILPGAEFRLSLKKCGNE
jgi:hypothetical protein